MLLCKAAESKGQERRKGKKNGNGRQDAAAMDKLPENMIFAEIVEENFSYYVNFFVKTADRLQAEQALSLKILCGTASEELYG